MYLEKIHDPSDVRALSNSECRALAQEIRQRLIDVVSQRGGHLASNLGAVELTIALHRAFSAPKDKIIFDVGHQSYTHKLLTGRGAAFETLRAEKVYSIIRDTNVASQNVARRSGMTRVASFVKHYRGADMPHGVYCVQRRERGE